MEKHNTDERMLTGKEALKQTRGEEYVETTA
jgi:hypothetical protein